MEWPSFLRKATQKHLRKKKKGSSVVPVRLRAFVSAAQVPCARTASRGLSLQLCLPGRSCKSPNWEGIKNKTNKTKEFGARKALGFRPSNLFFSFFFFCFFFFLVEIFIRVAYSINTKLQFTVFLHYSHMTSSLWLSVFLSFASSFGLPSWAVLACGLALAILCRPRQEDRPPEEHQSCSSFLVNSLTGAWLAAVSTILSPQQKV